WRIPFGILDAEYAYTFAASLSGLSLIPGGVLVAGRHMLATLIANGFPESEGVMTVIAAPLATPGISIVFGAVFGCGDFRLGGTGESHFDEIADAYDVQIPEGRRQTLLARKTVLMREILAARGTGPRGLDVGCGQGTYVAEMRRHGLDVTGIDMSAGQV